MERRFSIVEALRFGFYTTIENILFFLGLAFSWIGIGFAVFALSMAVFAGPFFMQIASMLKQMAANAASFHEILAMLLEHGTLFTIIGVVTLIGLVMKLVNSWLQLGFTKISLEFYDHGRASFGSLFSCARFLFRGFILAILYYLMVGIGLLFFIVPGVYLAVRYLFWPQILVDQDTSIGKTLSMSAEITEDTKWHLVGFLLILGIINWLAGFFFGIGLLITMPATMLALTYVYRKLLALPAVQ